MAKRFLRTDWMRHSKLGKNRKRLQRWRKPKGRHNKIRKKRFSYPVSVRIGYKSNRKKSGLVNGLKPLLIYNLKDLDKAGKNSIIIIGKIGAKEKLEIIKKADEKSLKILNISSGEKNYAVK